MLGREVLAPSDEMLMAWELLFSPTGPVFLPLLAALPLAAGVFSAWWVWFVGAALAIWLLLIAFGNMLGDAFQLPQLKAWSKTELSEFIVSVLLVSIAFFLIVFLQFATQALVGVPDPFYDAQVYLSVLRAKAVQMYLNLMEFEVLLGSLSTTGFSLPIPEAMVTFTAISITPLIGVQMVSDAHILLIDAIGAAIGMLVAQEVLLDFVRHTAMAFFFPLGLMFRSFPFTRRVGSTIIALALAAYFVYPLTISMNQAMANEFRAPDYLNYRSSIDYCNETNLTALQAQYNNWTKNQSDFYQEFYEGPTSQFRTFETSTSYWKPWDSLINPFLHGVREKGKMLFGELGTYYFAYGAVDPRGTIMGVFAAVLAEITPSMQLLVFIVFLPVLNIIITLAAFRSISASLSGEQDIVGLTKLI